MDYGMDSDNEFEVMYKDGKLVSTKDDDEENEEESDEGWWCHRSMVYITHSIIVQCILHTV